MNSLQKIKRFFKRNEMEFAELMALVEENGNGFDMPLLNTSYFTYTACHSKLHDLEASEQSAA